MVGTAPAGTNHLTTDPSDVTDSCQSNVTVRNSCSKFFDIQHSTLYGDSSHTTRVRSSTSLNIFRLIAPASNYERFVQYAARHRSFPYDQSIQFICQ